MKPPGLSVLQIIRRSDQIGQDKVRKIQPSKTDFRAVLGGQTDNSGNHNLGDTVKNFFDKMCQNFIKLVD